MRDDVEDSGPMREVTEPRPGRGRIGGWSVLIAIAAVVLGWPAWAGFYTDWLWYVDLGYDNLFWTTLTTKLWLGLSVGFGAFVVLALNFRLALRLSPSPPRGRIFTFEGREVVTPDFGRIAGLLVVPGALIIAAVVGSEAAAMWDTYLKYTNQIAFGQADPIFGRDVAYYFFTLPLLDSISRLLLTLIIGCLGGCLLIYASRTAQPMTAEPRFPISLPIGSGPRAQLLGIGAALMVTLAFRAYLSVPNLLFSNAGPVAGATYTDIAARLPLLYAQAGSALVAAVLLAVAAFRSRVILAWAGMVLYGLSIAAGVVFPTLLQRFAVAPNELAREAPYIEHNIAATRKAFGIDRVEERELDGDSALSMEDVRRNNRTVANIRLWDQQPLLDTFAQIQEIRTYYEFQSVDNDRYRINGEIQQVMLSPRDLSAASLPNRNWINERLTFTHGFGLTLGPVTQVTAEGLPVLFIKDLPPSSSVPSLEIQRPEIYFGELSSDFVYVNTKTEEFNYPSGEQNVSTRYEGTSGVSVGSLARQLLFATRFGDLKLLLSDDLTAESRVLFYRTIQERLGRVAPFLSFDSDPYMVISEGRLFWIADAYTISNRYPYSQPGPGGINYIRNSVKAVVDAYEGRVQLYMADATDPVVQTYARIFPGMFRPIDEMPPDLRSHLRYPEDIFKIQAAVYSTYHMDQPQVFYNKEDQWAGAVVAGGGREGAAAMEPYYTIMKLPDEDEEEFILMFPFTPARKDNLAAWMAARADGENYGKLLVYRFPKQKLVFGPSQVVARINQDPEISRQLTLWNQSGSQVMFGNLMVIPIEKSLIYVQALYLRAESGKIPELRRVIVAAENRIAMAATLEESLAAVFGGSVQAPAQQITQASPGQSAPANAMAMAVAGSGGDLLVQAKRHYDRALQAQRDGDWSRYGEEIRMLGNVLGQMK